jgi:hypothetical protein
MLGEELKSTALGVECVSAEGLGHKAMCRNEIEPNAKAARAWG